MTAAADRGWSDEVWRLREALWPLFLNRKHYRDWVATTLRGVEAAEDVADPAVEARMRSQLARAFVEQRQYEKAEAQLTSAVLRWPALTACVSPSIVHCGPECVAAA